MTKTVEHLVTLKLCKTNSGQWHVFLFTWSCAYSLPGEWDTKKQALPQYRRYRDMLRDRGIKMLGGIAGLAQED